MARVRLAAVGAALVVAAGCGGSEDGATARQAEVAQRGAAVMPFDLERATHVFRRTTSGGVEDVVSDDGDRRQVTLIRAHLRKEARRFARGDFSDPRAIHGAQMPGLATLEARADELRIRYEPLPNGGRIRYSADDRALVSAIHRWFAAQTSDHGAHATGH